MEEMNRSAAQMDWPVKTEWSPRCVIFTYFQGDISSVVDEHFSRALSNIKKPQELSSLIQSEDVALSNDGYLQIGDDLDTFPNEWCFSSEWTEPQPEVSFANNVANCSMNGFQPMAMTQYPQPLTGSPSVELGQLLHFSSPASTSSLEPEYPCGFSSGHLVSQAQPDGEYESLLNFPHQEICVAHPQQSAMWENCSSGQATRSTGSPFNQPINSAHCNKYFPPAHGPASVTLASDSLACERDLACNSGTCLNWEPNQRPLGSQPVLNPLSYTSQGEGDFLEKASLQREEKICSFIELQFEEENFFS